MTDRVLKMQYFLWMCSIVNKNVNVKTENYRELLKELHRITFYPIIEMDDNRAYDGIELRYKFGKDRGYSQAQIASVLDTRECSVLEMMVALAIRIEHDITQDDSYGDRTGHWFWSMIKSLALMDQYDDNFNGLLVRGSVHRMLEREYASNGKGGLFTVKNPREDLRNVEIWYQMMWYLNENM